MLQSVGEVAVVGEQQQTLGVGIQPSDVEEPVLAGSEEVGDRRATQLVAHRRDDAQGFVEGEVDPRLVELDPLAVNVDRLAEGVDADPELGDDMPVDLDTAGRDEVLAGPA